MIGLWLGGLCAVALESFVGGCGARRGEQKASAFSGVARASAEKR